MTTRSTHDTVENHAGTAQARLLTASAVVTNVVVRAAGVVPARLDLTHVGTAEQQLGLALGSVLFYLRTGLTARAVAEAWSGAAAGAVAGARGGRPPPAGERAIDGGGHGAPGRSPRCPRTRRARPRRGRSPGGRAGAGWSSDVRDLRRDRVKDAPWSPA